MGLLFTIGHSQHSLDYFTELLKRFNINYVIDVRSIPYSKYAEQFNKETLSEKLAGENIKYVFMGKYFGARPDDTSLYNKEGYLNFEKVRQSKNFNVGLDNVLLGLGDDNKIALMCTEKDPIDCHRAIMVARAFELKGIDVNHILPDGTVQSQNELNARLLKKYFPNRSQLSLFDDNEITEEDYLVKAYNKRNEEIGYHYE